MTNFIRIDDPIADNGEEELAKHKELIILVEAIKYCEIKKVDRIRYTELKKMSNARLATLTHEMETDFGGSFEKSISHFEDEKLVERLRKGRKQSFIIPKVKNIESRFKKQKLGKLFEEDALVKDPTFIEYEDDYLPSDKNSEGPLLDLLFPDVYSARYYYRGKNHVVFLNQGAASSYYRNGYKELRSSLGLYYKIDPDPFYKKSSHLYKRQGHILSTHNLEDSSALTLDVWNINITSPKDDNLKLKEDHMQKLLELGKGIASKDPTKPFRIILEYKGTSHNE
jgi:hypothetical protein